MAKSEAIEKLNMLNDALNWQRADADECSEALQMAINALERQDKIKEAFTHYPFSGFEIDVLSNCLQCLAEIKDILNGSDEE